MTRLDIVLSLLTALIINGSALAADWPQWLGPNRDGLTDETGLLQSWPEGGPQRVWLSRECGLGYSGPAIVNDTLYIMGARGDGEYLLALDTNTGQEVWNIRLGDIYENDWGNGPRGTPTVVGDMIYALAAKGALVCIDRTSGNEKWRVELVNDLGGQIPIWGYSESPLVDGNLVIVTPGNKEGAFAAIDRETGEVRWRSIELQDIAHYSSVMVAMANGRKQYVQLLEKRAVGIDPANGALLWQVPWPGSVAVIPTPMVRGNQVYVTSGYGAGCMLVEIGDDNTANVVYDNKAMKNHHGGTVLLGEHVYGHSEGVGWLCQDFATGKRIWRERGKLGKGAIGYADGRFYCLSESGGEVVLIAASTDGWQEHGRFTLAPQTELRKPKGKIWTHPVIANGKLYLRDQELLFCFDVSAK